MERKITINPVTRIEGHASVTVYVDKSNTVTAACLSIMDFRGFETFLQGMQVEMMPAVTSRICGTCPHTHHLAAAKAVDKVFGAPPPAAAGLMRNILNLGGIVHSHAIHLFMLAGPDLLLGLDAEANQRSVTGLAQRYPDLTRKSLRVRTLGQLICETIAGRGTHPVSMVPGGVAQPLDSDKRKRVRKYATEAFELGKELFTEVHDELYKRDIQSQSLPLETAYLGTVNNACLDMYEGNLRLRSPDGTVADFDPDTWKEHIVESAVDGSYGKIASLKNSHSLCSDMYRVGPLARLNCIEHIDTPLAQKAFEEFRHKGGFPCHYTVMYHEARMVELLYSLEKLMQLAHDPLLESDEVRTPCSSPRNASAHVEAPRGVLIHEYEVDANAIVTKANLLVATQHNIPAINHTVKLSAQQYIDQPDELLLNAIEFGIRCYDPCLSCATHRIGDMPLDVVIKNENTVIRRVRRT